MNKEHRHWHKDSAKYSGQDIAEMRGTRFFHPKTGRVYRIYGVCFDSERGRWMIQYTWDSPNNDEDIVYTHLPEDFEREGRFMKIEEN